MRSNCGWARLIDPESDEMVARCRVFVLTPAEAVVTRGGNADWHGEIDLVRPEGPALQDGTYTLMFEDGLDAHRVRLREVAMREEPSGSRARARVMGADSIAPAVLTELGGEE